MTSSDTTPSTGLNRIDWAALAFLAINCGVFLIFAARVEAYGSDTSVYYGLAQSLLDGNGYRFNFENHAVYPPGYPLILAGIMGVLGESFVALVRATIPIFFAGLAFVYWLVRGERDRLTALGVVALAGTSFAGFFWATAGLHSDIVYFAVSVAALLGVDVAGRTESSRTKAVAVVLATACFAYLPLVRSIGVALWAGLALWVGLPLIFQRFRDGAPAAERLKRWSPALLLTVVVLGGWMSWSGQVEPYEGDGHMSSYVQQVLKENPHELDSPSVTVLALPGRALEYLGVRARRTTQMVMNLPGRAFGLGNPVGALILLTVVLTIGVGFGRSILHRTTLTDCYVLAYMGVLALWPFDEGSRFLLPIHPFLLLYGIEGLNTIGGAVLSVGPWQSWGPRLFPYAKGLLLVGLVGLGALASRPFAERHYSGQPSVGTNDATLRVVDWITTQTETDAVIMAEQSEILHRLTGRRTYRFPLLTDASVIRRLIEETETAYIVVLDEEAGTGYFRPNIEERFEPIRAADPSRFPVVFDFDTGWVYQVGGAGQ